MFEFLMLTSFVLIVFSQQLPKEISKQRKPAVSEPDRQIISSKAIQEVSETDRTKKQPYRNINRAASSNYARKKFTAELSVTQPQRPTLN